MRWTRFAILLLIVTLLDAGNLLNLIAVPPRHIKPDLLLIMLVFFAANCETADAILISFLIGFAADLSGERSVMGPYTVSFLVFGALLAHIRKVIIVKRLVHQFSAIFVTALLARGLAQLLIILKVGPSLIDPLVVLSATALYSALLGPWFWIIFSLLYGWLAVHPHPYPQRQIRPRR